MPVAGPVLWAHVLTSLVAALTSLVVVVGGVLAVAHALAVLSYRRRTR